MENVIISLILNAMTFTGHHIDWRYSQCSLSNSSIFNIFNLNLTLKKSGYLIKYGVEQPEDKRSQRSGCCRAVRFKYFADFAGGFWLVGVWVGERVCDATLDLSPSLYYTSETSWLRRQNDKGASVIYHLESY